MKCAVYRCVPWEPAWEQMLFFQNCSRGWYQTVFETDYSPNWCCTILWLGSLLSNFIFSSGVGFYPNQGRAILDFYTPHPRLRINYEHSLRTIEGQRACALIDSSHFGSDAKLKNFVKETHITTNFDRFKCSTKLENNGQTTGIRRRVFWSLFLLWPEHERAW